MNPYDEIDGVLIELDGTLSDSEFDKARDRLYTILEETIEAARRGEYAD